MADQIPKSIQTHIPNVARMYDYYLGGKDNFPVDRRAAERALEIAPEIRHGARANRAFLERAVGLLTASGIDQFLDIGAGLPARTNVHQIAPGARIVHVDNDPTVLVHGRAILGKNENVTVVEGDVRRPGEILRHPDVRAAIDFDRPVGILLLAVMHFVPDADDPPGIVATLRRAVAPGSHLVLSHLASDARPKAARRVAEIYDRASAPLAARTGKEVARLFDGLDVVRPGVVNLPEWRPVPGAAVPYRGVAPYFPGGVGVVSGGG
ncbi:SAM-dependent methyltransferase [Streptosporangium sp. NPDC048865]|uniref:SAM-dependent methyltransferase n=1 Tax=Streptosporangium sp. NPDC048865 TaxID=3155766 RepID=UPI0034194AE6